MDREQPSAQKVNQQNQASNTHPGSQDANSQTQNTHVNVATSTQIQNSQMDEQNQQQNNEEQWTSEQDQQQIDDNSSSDFQDEDSQEMSGDSDQQQQQPINIAKLQIQAIPSSLLPILNSLQNLNDLSKYIKLPASKKIAKQVCAKIIKMSETVVQCFDCRMDQTCIICMECFKNGNHEGHKYVAKYAAGGCCDCGDAEAWSEKGFCKSHSGKFKDFQIEDKVLESFSKITDGLMYLYFQMVGEKSQKSENFIHKLLQFFQKMNLDNTYYNKLFAKCLCKKLPAAMNLNQQLDKKTILQNILTTKISGKYFSRWFEIFISMFSYYPFKLQILKHYIQNFSDISDGSKIGINNSIGISCQIITSYKLVQQYCAQNSMGIGQNGIVPKNINRLKNYYVMFLHDLTSLSGLSQKTPYLYWEMHINGKEGITNLFSYYKILMKNVKQYESTKTEAQICVNFINFAETQLNLLQTFLKIMKVIQEDQGLLQKVINNIWTLCQKSWKYNPQTLCILRPLQRCLAIALYTYFNYSLQDMTKKRQQLLKQVLKISEEQFDTGCSMVLGRMFKTLLFYAKSQAQAGLGQSLMEYVYIYKVYSKLICMSDILCIKIFLLLQQRKYPLTFQSIIELDRQKLQSQAYLKQKTIYLIQCLKLVKIIFTNFQPQIYIGCSVDPNTQIYQKQIKYLVLNFFKQYQKDGIFQVPQNVLKQQLLEGIFPPECKSVENYIKNNFSINKNRKSYTLNKQTILQEGPFMIGLNLDDFWLSASSKDPFADIPKSAAGIKAHNIQIFNILWNKVSLQSLHQIVGVLCNQKVNNQGMIPILPIIYAVYLTMTYQKSNQQQENKQILKTILVKDTFIDKIPKSAIQMLKIQRKQSSKMQEEVNQVQRKQKMNQIKAKKLQKFKKKQQTFLTKHSSEKQEHRLQKLTKKLTEQNIMNQQSSCCCICRGELNQSCVYIVNLNIKNHQKLLHLGPGVRCLSLNTCKHIFDMKCIEKMYKANKIIGSISCPLCKNSGNLLFPASLNYNPKIQEQLLQRVGQILRGAKKQANVYQQAIKCFYHYLLLCAVDFDRTFEKKSQIYKILFRIIRKNITSGQLQKLQYKLKQNKISKNFQNELKNQNNKQPQRSAITMLFSLLANQNNGERVAQLQSQYFYDLDKKQQIKQPKITTNISQHVHGKQQQEQNSMFFRVAIKYILQQLKHNAYVEKKEMTEMHAEQTSLQQFIRLCFSTILSNQKPKITEQDINCILSRKNLHIFKQLPRNYLQLNSIKQCSACSQISTKLLMCLLCGWHGCQNCENGYAINHMNEQHGGVGAVMTIQKGLAYYITNQKSVLAGNLYEDEWLNNVGESTNWEKFQLNQNLYNQMQIRICRDQIPTQNTKKKNQ